MKTKEEIIRIFGDSGLLVRTVQLKDLDKNFNDIEDDVTTAVEKAKTQQYYGPLRKWSIGHSELPPFFYKMETEGAFARFLAILVEPALVDWSRYIHISTTDLSSSYSVKVDTTCLEASQAKEKYDKTLKELQAKTDQNQNSEIATLGFRMESFCGLLFKGYDDLLTKHLDEIKGKLANIKNEVGFIPVFTYEQNGRGTILKHLFDI